MTRAGAPSRNRREASTARRVEEVAPRRRNRRRERHEATRQEIVAAAWEMVREEGLSALSLRELARAVGMEAQSLYTYFPSKLAIYDAMFAEANTELAEQRRALGEEPDPVKSLARGSRLFVEFCTTDPVRYQLLFQRTIPGFEPSEESYAIARENLDVTRSNLAAIGITSAADLDLFTAMIAGLVSQQISNDPGGDRWTRQLDRVFDMYLHEVADIRFSPARKTNRSEKQKSEKSKQSRRG